MMGLGFITALVLINISPILTFPIGSSLPNSAKKRADSCSLFDTDPRCLFNNDSFLFAGAETARGLLPNEAVPNDDLDSYRSLGQISLMDELSMPSLDTNFVVAGNLNSDFSPSQIDGAESRTESNILLDNFPMTDQAEMLFGEESPGGAYDGDISSASPRPLPVIYSYICVEYGDTCAQYKDGLSTGIIRYSFCEPKDKKCRLCDVYGEECDPDAGWDRQAIPSPYNPDGQPWNHCRNKKCGACETAAGLLGILSLGIIPGCGPPKFD